MAELRNSKIWAVAPKRTLRVLIPLLLLGWAASCVREAPVIQGKVLSVERGGAVIRVADEKNPAGAAMELDISKAEIGNPPKPEDVIRAAYRIEGGTNVALRVMNLTRQKEKGGH